MTVVNSVGQVHNPLFLFSEIPLLQIADGRHKTLVMVRTIVNARECTEVVAFPFMLHHQHPKHLPLVGIHLRSIVAMSNHLPCRQLTKGVRTIAEGVGELWRGGNAFCFKGEGMEQR